MALWGKCFGSTECPLSVNKPPVTFFTINKNQYILRAFHEWELLLSYGCRKTSRNGQNGHIQIFREPSNQNNVSIWTTNCYGYIFHYIDKTLKHRNVSSTYLWRCSACRKILKKFGKMSQPSTKKNHLRLDHVGSIPQSWPLWSHRP
jgi:hypothetical protein